MRFSLRSVVLIAMLIVSGTPKAISLEYSVTVYSYRNPVEVRPLFDAFERKTGIKVNLVFIKEGVKKRLVEEGKNSPADLIFTVDITRFKELKEAGLTQALHQKG